MGNRRGGERGVASLLLLLTTLFGSVNAEGVILDETFESTRQQGRLSKCVDSKGRVTYTDRWCPQGSKLMDDSWIDETNITHKERVYRDEDREAKEEEREGKGFLNIIKKIFN